ncbi:MAG: TolC family protein [Synergistaceae bacterium]|jgi:outer membrane protein TolC|nr:TolC family protein [Synergistaceae bacterium]
MTSKGKTRKNPRLFCYLFCYLFFAVLGAGLGSSRPSWAAPVLSLADCLAIAEANHPNIAGAAGQVATQRGRLAQSAAADRLEVSGSVSASRAGTNYDENASYSIGATTSIKVFDANRNKYLVDSQRITLSATEEEGRSTLIDVRAGVKSSYMTLSLNMEIAQQRLESVRAFEHHLEQAKGFYQVGSKPWYDVTKAEVDLGSAQLALVEAEGNIETARAALLNAMGIDQQEEFDIVSPDISSTPRELQESAFLENLAALALDNRPDYRAAALRILAGEASLSAEARASSPNISLTGGYNSGGDDVFDLEKAWNAGLRMSVPIVDGGAAKARIHAAQGQLLSLTASREKLRQDIMLEVRKTLTDLTKARERIRISELTLVSAEENRKMATGRYETGVGDSLEVTDALLSFADAQLAHRQACYDLQLAIIGLEKAAGKEFIE